MVVVCLASNGPQESKYSSNSLIGLFDGTERERRIANRGEIQRRFSRFHLVQLPTVKLK